MNWQSRKTMNYSILALYSYRANIIHINITRIHFTPDITGNNILTIGYRKVKPSGWKIIRIENCEPVHIKDNLRYENLSGLQLRFYIDTQSQEIWTFLFLNSANLIVNEEVWKCLEQVRYKLNFYQRVLFGSCQRSV